jgi:hypothetical protein
MPASLTDTKNNKLVNKLIINQDEQFIELEAHTLLYLKIKNKK